MKTKAKAKPHGRTKGFLPSKVLKKIGPDGFEVDENIIDFESPALPLLDGFLPSASNTSDATVSVISRLQGPKPRVRRSKPSGPRPRVRHLLDVSSPPGPTSGEQQVDLEETRQDTAFMLRRRAAEARAKLIELCRTDVSTCIEYVMVDDATGQTIEQSPFHFQLQDDLTKHTQIVVMAHPESGKALPLSTPIPTPRGWRTMGELSVGSRVFGSDGKPCAVTFVTPVQFNRRVFEVEFEDGVVIKADADHQWAVRKRQSTQRVATTLEMLGALREADGHYRWAVPVAKPVQYAKTALPLPAYVLGAWLGNGTAGTRQLSFNAPDRFVWDQCVGGSVGGRAPSRDNRNQMHYGTGRTEWGSVRQTLLGLGVLKDKHIPEIYLRAAEEDRRALLAGLLDTDGDCSKTRSRTELSFCNQRLATDALELVRSLGFRASIAESDAAINGRVVERRWRITFTAHTPVFRIPGKLGPQDLTSRSERPAWKHVVAIREVATEPVRCIQVDSADHTYLCDRSYTVTHNTNQLIGRVLFELGKNPNMRIMWLCNAEDSAMKSLATIRRYIESSDRLHEVFPHLKRGDIWKDDAINVVRTNYSRDPSVTAAGYNSRRIQGSRVDLLVADDLLDSIVTATESQRRKISSWLKNTVFTRLTDNARVAFLTNAWHPRDLAHELVRDRGWHLLKRAIRNEDGTIWWHRWSETRLKKLKKSLGALEYARSYECDPRDDGSRVFRPEHVENALKRGKGYGFVNRLSDLRRDTIVVTGVDLATGDDVKKQQGAKTVITSVFFHPNQDRQVIRIRAGRWRARKILEELALVGSVYPENQHWIVVENNGVQRWIIELMQENHMDISVRLIPFQTGRNKTDPRFGVASMAAEYEGDRWILPSTCVREDEQADVEALVAQMIDYVPEAHTGDYLMSLWFAREIGRKIFKRLVMDTDQGSEGSVVRMIG